MAKQGQHNNDAFDQDKSPGHNNPSQSQTITTGSPKKQETYEREARQHKNPAAQAQAQKNEWDPTRKDPPSKRDQSRSPNEIAPMTAEERWAPDHVVLVGDHQPPQYRDDLNPNRGAGLNEGLTRQGELGPSAYDVKDVHDRWSSLNDADLKNIPVLAEGTRLKQGATYFDMNDPDRGEFTARGDMEAGPNDRYVAKDAVGYQLWNALIGVQNPERLGIADER